MKKKRFTKEQLALDLRPGGVFVAGKSQPIGSLHLFFSVTLHAIDRGVLY